MRMKRTIKQVGICAVTFLLALTSANADEIVSAKDPNAILNIAKGFGSARLDKDGQGDPAIIGRINGVKYVIAFYGCKKNIDCDEIQFNSGWSGTKVSLDKINQWNREKRYGKAFLDKDGDPALQMIVNLDHGVTVKNLEDTFNWWSRTLTVFKKVMIGTEKD